MDSDSWSDLDPPLSPAILRTLERLNFMKMTPVQASTIPLFLGRKDVAAEAVTGSGKTLAFVIPILETLLKVPPKTWEVGALIISPTRELASQISEVLQQFLVEIPAITQMLFIGGSNVAADMKQFEETGANVIIATPGRLEDILIGKTKGSNATKIKAGLKSLEMLVLDEADRLLSMGFEKALNTIMACLPKLRRTGLFSATQTKDVVKLIRAGLRNPVLVSVKEKGGDENSQKTPSTLDNNFVICEPEKKFASLIAFLKERDPKEKIMLFFATCACVEYFAIVLTRLLNGRKIWAIHSKKVKRNSVFDEFRKAEAGILVCTDVMARGIDIPEVHWVIQFDPPSNAEAFVHRCGRTARIGHQGAAVLFLLPSEDAYVDFIRLNQKVTMHPMNPPENVPDLLHILRQWQQNDRSIFDKATRAFVSSVQAYSKHECKFVLRMKDLPFGALATSFGLLKMPRMPELKGKRIVGFKEDNVKDMNEIKYKDKQKEKSRQDKLKVFESTGKWPGFKGKQGESSLSWSDRVEKKERRDLRQKKKELKKRKAVEVAVDERFGDEEGDLDELESDYRMLKRMKKGKISQETFDQQMDLDQLEFVQEITVKGGD